jgi:hypothetical protein
MAMHPQEENQSRGMMVDRWYLSGITADGARCGAGPGDIVAAEDDGTRGREKRREDSCRDRGPGGRGGGEDG